MLSWLVETPAMPAASGAASTVITAVPLTVGLHMHVATLFVEEPDVGSEIHPAMRVLPTKNVRSEGTFTVAEMVLF